MEEHAKVAFYRALIHGLVLIPWARVFGKRVIRGGDTWG